MQNKKLTYQEQVIASLIGGVASALVTLPVDVMVAQVSSNRQRVDVHLEARGLSHGG